jgi:predicted amidohydrolase YtcJ
MAGWAVAMHATSAAEVAIALDAISAMGRPLGRGRHRIEHASVVPDALLTDLRTAGVMVVGQPTLVAQHGDFYLEEHPAELHGWLHRARSFVRAGIPYAIGSDAPVGHASPRRGFVAATGRRTRSGTVLGEAERLSPRMALEAMTSTAAASVGASRELGRIKPGAVADITVLDPDVLTAPVAEAEDWIARLTLLRGRVVWRRGG